MLSRTMNNQELLDRIEKQCRNVLRILLQMLPGVWVWPSKVLQDCGVRKKGQRAALTPQGRPADHADGAVSSTVSLTKICLARPVELQRLSCAHCLALVARICRPG